MTKILLPVLALFLSSTLLFAQDELFTRGRTFSKEDHITSASVFTWYSKDQGQLVGPWRPLEGRENWTGETDWWKTQIKQMMMANLDVMWVHLIGDEGEHLAANQRFNLFKAISEMRSEGYDVPKIAPFLDPIILWGDKKSLDVSTEAGKDKFVEPYITFFEQYYATNTDRYADSYLEQIDNQIVLDTWHVFISIANPDSLTKEDIEKRLIAKFGDKHPIFKNGIRFVGTCLTPPLLFTDEIVAQFSVHEYYHETTHNGITSVQLKGGYWDQNVGERDPGYLLPRDGGKHYRDAWAKIDRNKVNRIYIESWNEYDEGSGIYAADPGEPYLPYFTHAVRSDFWSDTNDPYEYIKTTAKGIAAFNDYPDYSAQVIWENIPRIMKKGEKTKVKMVVRNTGNTSWDNATGVNFSQNKADKNIFFSEVININDSENEISIYGGIFRGRPVTFEFEITAPNETGIYTTHWSMVDKNKEPFGRQKSVIISVE